MAFDVSGIFQRLFNFEDDRDNNIKILASRMDDELDEIGEGLDAIVGQTQPFINPVKLPNGLVGAPALTFSSEEGTGLYKHSDGGVRFAIEGVEQFAVNDDAITFAQSLTINGKAIIGGFKTRTASGVLDWNDATNARVGMGDCLLRGTTATNAPEPSASDYIPFCFGHDDNLTQLAIPYGHATNSIWSRTRTSGTWTAWQRMLTTSDLTDLYDAGNLTGTIGNGDVTIEELDNHEANTGNPHGVTKTQVGLGNVDNTADLDKPVPTSIITALAEKLPKAGGDVTGNINLAATAFLEHNGVEAPKIHRMWLVEDVTVYDRASTATNGSGSDAGTHTPTNANTKLVAIYNVRLDAVKNTTGAGSDLGTSASLETWDGSAYNIQGRTMQLLFSNVTTNSSAATFRSNLGEVVIIDQSTGALNGDGDWQLRMRFKSTYSNSVASMYNATFLLIEIEEGA